MIYKWAARWDKGGIVRGGSTSFFAKKEAKKLSFIWGSGVDAGVVPMSRSFLLLFYKKEALPKT
ncbi:hypothetical protein AruPA_03745 [Acidiphilium sp. PA]|uniref:hypothetical protein n=1 Tax=Acidiphilium sp. PA TaxID=2871705 RepID=UPI00224498AC|nr:hypothetical protein [Acidiphilium sp. PA]MCW8306140.1 hypothetical protein [Acidiphilium sp. PA]